MVGRRDHDDVTGKRVDLEKERAHDPFDLSRLVGVATLFAECVEFVEEQDTRSGSGKVEERGQTPGGFAEKAADHSFIADHEEGKHQCVGQRVGERSLAVSRRAYKEQAMARFETIGA